MDINASSASSAGAVAHFADEASSDGGGGNTSLTSANANQPSWFCAVCTFENAERAYRCDVCHASKGTSTRNSGRVSAAQQAAQRKVEQKAASAQKLLKRKSKTIANARITKSNSKFHDISDSSNDTPAKGKPGPRTSTTTTVAKKNQSKVVKPPAKTATLAPRINHGLKLIKLKNVDRENVQVTEVTVNGVTVVITEFPAMKSVGV